MAFRPLAPLASLSFLTVLAIPSLASANPPGGVEAPDQDPLIANGSPVAACAWPTAVAVSSGGGLCTGTLIHPELVVYAAHCGGGSKTIRFGESAFSGGQTASVAFCRTNPEYSGTTDQGRDWAFCRLSEPVTNIPITPPVAGPCENSIIQIGQEVAVVGFGQTLQGGAGNKNWGFTNLLAVSKADNIVALGGSGTSSVCPGDSGGPAYVEFPDGSWHAFGIASTVSGGCGGTGTHSLLEGALPWLESESGLDLTPCTDREGNWTPGPGCGGYNALAANQGTGTWSNWCSGVPVSGNNDVCGPAWDEFDSSLVPTVELTYPVWGDTFPENSAVDILATAVKHPEGFSVKEVRLEINGGSVAADPADPYLFAGAQFVVPGVYELVAVAEDWAGNIVASEPVAIGIGDTVVPPKPEPEPEPEPTDDSGDGSGDDGSEDPTGDPIDAETGDGGGASSDSGGCSVDSSGPRGWWLLGLGLLGLGLRRRRDA